VKISILCFDLSINAAGRADLLARLLAPRFEVEVVGPVFGDGIWPPVSKGPIRYRSVRGGASLGFPKLVSALLNLADGDLLYASKPRSTSFGIGLLKRRMTGRPLVLDIDDWEAGFFYRSGFWGGVGRFLNVGNPNGLPWTWLMERLASRADRLTVGSRFLERRFRGLLIPHVRDTESWRPGVGDTDKARALLGLKGGRVVMFLGTPRDYKGIDDLALAIRRLNRPDVILAVVGCAPESRTGKRLASMGPAIRAIGPIPFHEIPDFLSAADLIVVPQRLTSDTVGQVPAKLFDAMALGRPIVSTRVSMIPEILDGCGLLVEPERPEEFERAIGFLLDHPGEAAALGMKARARCEERYSYASARASLFPLFESLLARRSA
jgi:glycosyltransferase involved in cell wall biosynthesis